MKRFDKDAESVRLGMTQSELADAIGVSRSQLSMYERGLRDLPIEGIIKLSALTRPIILDEIQAAQLMDEAAKARAAFRRAAMEDRLDDNKYELFNATKRLEKLEIRYAKNATRAQTARAFKTVVPEKRSEAYEVVSNQVARATNKLFAEDVLKAITTLEVKIELLKREQAAIKEFLEKPDKL